MSKILNSGGRRQVTATPPLYQTDNNLTIAESSSLTDGYLSSTDWNTFNNKVNQSQFNYITNPGAEINTTGWNLYNDQGRTTPAFVVINDITFTAVASEDTGNGINIDYIFNASQSYTTPLVTVVSPTHITVAWYNGPTVSNNPSATQLKAAFDAVPGATAIATSVITGVATNLQFITGAHLLALGGDSAPSDGTGGAITGLTLTRNTTTPLAGVASFDLGKDASNREGEGVSTDFTIDPIDEGESLQITFAYKSSSGIVLGSSSDVQIFIYDVTNFSFINITPLRTLPGPTSTVKTFTGVFQAASNSLNYRLIFHVATTNAVAWDLLFDVVTVNDRITSEASSLVLPDELISGSVTDHMAVAWIDGATQWVPATSSYNGDYLSMLGFATNISGNTADIYISGQMGGFNFSAFAGYNQYIDPSNPGALTPLPAPFTDTYVIMGKALSSTSINIQIYKGKDLISSKGGILTNAGANNGTSDQTLAVGTNGNVLIANSVAAVGLSWNPAVVVASPMTYTTATRTLSFNSQNQNLFFASPNGSSGTPTFRAIAAADIPTLNQNTTGTASNVTASSNTTITTLSNLVSVGTITTGTWNATTLAINHGGTGQTTAATAYAALSPLTTKGDIVYETATPSPARLAIGATGNVLTVSAGLPVWSAPATSGTVTSVAFSDASTTPIYIVTGSPVTSSGTLTHTLVNQSANTIFAGPSSGAAAQPTFRSIVSADIPTLNQNTTGTALNITAASNSTLTSLPALTSASTLATVGTVTTGTWNATTIAIAKGGTGQTTANAGFNALSPMTTAGDIIYENSTPVAARLGIGSTGQVLTVSGGLPVWAGISNYTTVNARYHGATATITGTLSNVSWTTKDFDTATAFAGATFTVPALGAGTYQIFGSLGITAATVAVGNTQILTLNKNGAEISRYTYISGVITQKPIVLTLSDLFTFAVGDTITFQVSSASTTPSVSASNTQNFFFINKVSN